MSTEIQKVNVISSVAQKKKIDLSKLNQKALAAALSKFEPPRLFYQLIVFILDASESMTWEGMSGVSKGVEIKRQIPNILDRLKKSKNKNCFDISMIAFSKEFHMFIPISSVQDISQDSVDFNPCSHVNNLTTYMEGALAATESLISTYHAKHLDHSQSLVIILTDGALNDYASSANIIERLKASGRTTVSTCLLEDRKWNDTIDPDKLDTMRLEIKNLASIDSNGQVFFFNTVDPEEIRNHMIKSISTVSKVD
jgi:uncharacterized protein YegL